MTSKRAWILQLTVALAASAVLAAACSEEPIANDDDDDGSGVTSSSTGVAGSTSSVGGSVTSTGGMGGAGATGGMTSSGTGASGATGGAGGMGGSGPCAGAPVLGLSAPISDAINPAADKDYYQINATAGQWLVLFTDANPNDDPNMVDTVLTLFAADGVTQLAEADDQAPRVSTDSEIYFHVPTTGTYCLRVMEYSEWSNMSPEGNSTFTYDVYAADLDFTNIDSLNEDSDPNPSNNTQNTAQSLTFNLSGNTASFTTIAGLQTPGTDVDYYAVPVPSQGVVSTVNFMPDGTSGHGSTQGPGLVRMRNSGGQVVAELNYQQGSDSISVPTTGGLTYYLEVNRPNTSVGANDFYFFKVNQSDTDNEDETESNNTSNVANVATPVANGQITSHFVQGTISASSDVDYWSFTATSGQSLSVACAALRGGSGLINFSAALRNIGDTSTLESETEVATADMLWSTAVGSSRPAYSITQSGIYYMRLGATGQVVNHLGRYYRCGIHLQ